MRTAKPGPGRPPGSKLKAGPGRPKGLLNKRTIMERAKAAMAGEHVEVPKEFDSLMELQRIAIWYIGVAAEEQDKGDRGDRSIISEMMECAARVLRDIVPYQHSRLARLDVQQTPIDPSDMSDEELATVAGIIEALAIRRSRTGGTGPAVN